jgi:hypothetical protein
MLIKGYIHQECGETPTDLRMGVPALTTTCTFAGLSVTLNETHRKAAIHAPYKSSQDAGKLEDKFEM